MGRVNGAVVRECDDGWWGDRADVDKGGIVNSNGMTGSTGVSNNAMGV